MREEMKKVSLNKPIRSEIINSIMAEWDIKNPSPPIGNALNPNSQYLVKKRDLKIKRDEYNKRLTMSLSTFKTIDELEREWPKIGKYVPEFISKPSEAIELP